MADVKAGEDDRGEKRSTVVLILGGARSGKSRYAQRVGEAVQGKRLFVATAQGLDKEMVERIERHKRQRGDLWETREEPLEIGKVIAEAQDQYAVVLIDCLTLWISNLLITCGDDQQGLERHIQDLMDRLPDIRTTLILVSNEVGLGIVPENRLARSFRDMAGMLNQCVAEVADRVILMVAGIPMIVKGGV
jgi:adenosylcobinamide kinase/adenosylcobinamide-phosphate guanylyltransferase